MIIPDNLLWCALVMAALLAAWGVIAWLGREKPTDWTATAHDLNEVDAAYAEARAMQTRGRQFNDCAAELRAALEET